MPTTARWPAGDLSDLLRHLQRTAGNQAVNALLQRWTASVAPPEQQRGLGRSGPPPLDPTGARPMREAEEVGGTATTDAVAGRDPAPVVAGPARVSRAIQRAGDGHPAAG